MFIRSTNSTNTQLKEMLAKGTWPEGERYLYAGYQTAGRGQTGNHWESEEGKNLICSIVLPPDKNLYFLNIAVSVALVRMLGDAFAIKWPNDIYWQDQKAAGILLENAIIGNEVRYAIAGIGLNVNQTAFLSEAPNPVSLKQITGKEYDIDEMMQTLWKAVQTVLEEPEETVWSEYKAHLYRKEGYWPFEDQNGVFEARIEDVLPSGEIVLRDKNGKEHTYGFKQIKFRI